MGIENSTPRPWRMSRERNGIAIYGAESVHYNGHFRNSVGISRASYTDKVCVVEGGSHDHDLDPVAPEANAELIITAVNAYSELLKEVDRLIASHKNAVDNWTLSEQDLKEVTTERDFLRAKCSELTNQLKAQGSTSYIEVQKTCGIVTRQRDLLQVEKSKLITAIKKIRALNNEPWDNSDSIAIVLESLL